MDITGHSDTLYESDGHGLWMATVLKEIAPECEIYALNAVFYGSEKSVADQDEERVEYFTKALNWAIENKIDILTYSHGKFSNEMRHKADQAIDKAVHNGTITTFIHCDNPNNIYPYGCMKFSNDEKFRREPDVNILHFDYNALILSQYDRYMESIRNGEQIRSGNNSPYFSFSSMSPVLGGFAAILKSIKQNLTAEECKDILIKTSYEVTDRGERWYDINPCPRVVDIGKAVQFLLTQS